MTIRNKWLLALAPIYILMFLSSFATYKLLALLISPKFPYKWENTMMNITSYAFLYTSFILFVLTFKNFYLPTTLSEIFFKGKKPTPLDEIDTTQHNSSYTKWYFAFRIFSSMPVIVIFYVILPEYFHNHVIGREGSLTFIVSHVTILFVLSLLIANKIENYSKYSEEPTLRDHNGFSYFFARLDLTFQELKAYRSFLVFISCFFFSNKTQTRVLYPLIADMMHEIDKAKSEGKTFKSKW